MSDLDRAIVDRDYWQGEAYKARKELYAMQEKYEGAKIIWHKLKLKDVQNEGKE